MSSLLRDPIACNASMRQTGLSAICSLQYWRFEMLVAEISDLIYRILLGLSIHRKMSSFAYMKRVLTMNCVKLNAYSHHQKCLAGEVKQNSSLSVRNSPQHEWCKTHCYACGCSCKLNCLVYWMNLLQSVRGKFHEPDYCTIKNTDTTVTLTHLTLTLHKPHMIDFQPYLLNKLLGIKQQQRNLQIKQLKLNKCITRINHCTYNNIAFALWVKYTWLDLHSI